MEEEENQLQDPHQEIATPLLPSEDELEDSPIEQVALTVPTTDDPNAAVVTARMWILGMASCVVLAFLNQFFWYRKEPLSITSISAQIAVVPLARAMAAWFPDRRFFAGSRWEFSLNPGPFSVKEHVLITIFANAGAGSVYAIHVVTAVRVFYRQNISFFVSLLVVLTTQVLGFGWAGIFRRYLVEPAAMWWPHNLVQVSLFRGSSLKPQGRGLTGHDHHADNRAWNMDYTSHPHTCSMEKVSSPHFQIARDVQIPHRSSAYGSDHLEFARRC